MPLLVNSYDAQVFIPADGILLNCNEIFYSSILYHIFFNCSTVFINSIVNILLTICTKLYIII